MRKGLVLTRELVTDGIVKPLDTDVVLSDAKPKGHNGTAIEYHDYKSHFYT